MSPLVVVATALIVVLAVAATQSFTLGVACAAGIAAVIALSRTLRRFKPSPLASSSPVLGLVFLPLTLGMGVFSLQGSTVVTLGLVLFTLVTRRKESTTSVSWWIVALLFISWLLPASRNQLVAVVVLHLGVFALLIVCARRYPFPALVASLLDGIGVYLVANVLGHLAGLESPVAMNRTFSLESTTGGLRVFYPFTSGLSTPPALAGIFVACALICLEGRPWRRALRIVALGAAIWILFEGNTRTAILICAAVCLAVVFAPRLIARAAVPAVSLTVALPFTYPVLLSILIRPFITSVVAIAPFLSRGNVEKDIELEGRSPLWSNALDYWTGDVDVGHALMGYGTFGHYTSGASGAYISGTDPALYMLSVHNSAFQQLYDGGVAGLACLVVAWMAALVVAAKRALIGSRAHLLALAAMVALLCGGATEVAQAPGYGMETFWILAGFVIAVAVSRGTAETTVDGGASTPAFDGHSRGRRYPSITQSQARGRDTAPGPH